MIEVRLTEAFLTWFASLRDLRAKAQIARRIDRAEAGNLGDIKRFDGIGEMRIKYGPGYRLYFVQRGEALIILLCGGAKRTQKRDIATAKAMAKDV